MKDRPGIDQANLVTEVQEGRRYIRRVFWILSAFFLALLVVITLVDPREYPVGGYCGLKNATGMDCCGCGATRSTYLIVRGQFAEAMRYNALWTIGWPFALYVFVSMMLDFGYGRVLPGRFHSRRWFWIAVGVLLVVYSIVRNLPWYPFTLLATP